MYEKVISAKEALRSLLNTKRGSKVARAEAAMRHDNAKALHKCSGCGAAMNDTWLVGHSYCENCLDSINRMQMFKSDLRPGIPISKRRVTGFIRDYIALQDIPYSLRGEHSLEEIMKASHALLDAIIADETQAELRKARQTIERLKNLDV